MVIGATFANKDELKNALDGDITDIANWGVSKVTDMSQLFKDRKTFNVDISSWNTASVTDMNYMFHVRSARALAPTALSQALPMHMPIASPPPIALMLSGPYRFPHRMPACRLGSARRRSTSCSASTHPRSRTCGACSPCALRVPCGPQP